MLRERPGLACVVFVIAGGCGWIAMNASPSWIMTIGLWFGAVGFTGLGFGILLGKVNGHRKEPPWPAQFDPTSNPYPGVRHEERHPDPPWTANPVPVAPAPAPVSAPIYSEPDRTTAGAPQPGENSEELVEAVVDSGKRIVNGMRLVMMVASLVIVVPLCLLFGILTVFAFLQGEIGSGFTSVVLGALVGGYCWYLIRKREWIPFDT